jgi:hypothetical protein
MDRIQDCKRTAHHHRHGHLPPRIGRGGRAVLEQPQLQPAVDRTPSSLAQHLSAHQSLGIRLGELFGVRPATVQIGTCPNHGTLGAYRFVNNVGKAQSVQGSGRHHYVTETVPAAMAAAVASTGVYAVPLL